mgnify:CR=1 FL=1
MAALDPGSSQGVPSVPSVRPVPSAPSIPEVSARAIRPVDREPAGLASRHGAEPRRCPTGSDPRDVLLGATAPPVQRCRAFLIAIALRGIAAAGRWAGAVLARVEHELLGESRPDARGHVRSSGWSRDAVEAYCPRCGCDRPRRDQSTEADARFRAEAHHRDALAVIGPSAVPAAPEDATLALTREPSDDRERRAQDSGLGARGHRGSGALEGEIRLGSRIAGCAACADRGGMPRLGDRVIRLGRYDAPLRDWLLALKYTRWQAIGELLGRELGNAVLEALGPTRAGDSMPVVVPMPMPFLRRVHRGIDHARVLADAVAAEVGGVVRQPLRSGADSTQAGRRSSARRRLGGRRIRIRRTRLEGSLKGLGALWRSVIGVAVPARGALRGPWEGPRLDARLDRSRIGGLGAEPRSAPARAYVRHRWMGWGLSGRTVILVDDIRTTGRSLEVAVSLLRSLGPARIVVAVVATAQQAGRRRIRGRQRKSGPSAMAAREGV